MRLQPTVVLLGVVVACAALAIHATQRFWAGFFSGVMAGIAVVWALFFVYWLIRGWATEDESDDEEPS